MREEDLDDMYKLYREIMLWVFSSDKDKASRKRHISTGDSDVLLTKTPRTNYSDHANELEEVEAIVRDLEEKTWKTIQT